MTVAGCLTYSQAMRRVHPPKAVEVERDASWHPGQLEAWQRHDDDWRAFVRYSTGTGMQHLEWVDAERVRESTP